MTDGSPPTPRWRMRFFRLAQVAMAVALLLVVWRLADGGEAFRRLSQAEPLLLIAAAVALTAQTVFSALRWRLTAGQLGLRMSAGNAIGEYYLSQVVNQTLPGGVLGDAGRAIRARGHAGLLAASQSVIFERLAGQLALLVVMAVALATHLAIPGGVGWPTWVIVLVGAIWGIVMTVAIGLVGLRRARGRLGERATQLVNLMIRAWWAVDVRWRQLAYSLATALLNIIAFTLCAWAIGSNVTVTDALVLVPLVLFTMVIPVTVSGWGLREGAAAALFPLVGAVPSEGLATSVAFGLVFLASSLPGVALVRLRKHTGGRE